MACTEVISELNMIQKVNMVGKKKVKPEQDAIEHLLLGKDKDFIEGRNINTFKGRGVIALEHIEPSTFVVEYRGILSQNKHAEDIHQGDFLYNFTWNGAHYCIDASEEDGTLGRLVNDDHRNPNCKVKTIIVEGKPHLCLFSVRDIFPGEEITYNYGDFSWPWRTMELYDKTSVAECSVNPFTAGREKQDGELSSFDEATSDEDDGLYADKCTEEYSDDFNQDFGLNNDIDDSLSINTWKPPYYMTSAALSESSKKKAKNIPQPNYCAPVEEDISDKSSAAQDDHDTNKTERLQSYKSSDKQAALNIVSNPKDTLTTRKNYCYVCKKPQSKIARHLKKHQDSEAEIAAAFSFPKHSKERKRLLEKLRNRGNYEHNQEVMDNKSGPLKVRRRPVRSEIILSAKTYVHCVYCKGMFIRKELWRHLRRCHSKTVSESETAGKARVLVLADIAESTFSQAISPEVWRILGKMKSDDVSSVVRNDFLILQMSQCLYNKHGSDPAKSEYIRQQVRDVGRLLLSLRQKYSIFNFEDAVKADNVYKVIQAVKDVAGYDEKRRSCKTPCLTMKLQQSLRKIGDIILCRAIRMEDDALIKAAESFKRLCSSEWTENICRASPDNLSKTKSNKTSAITFTQDVQRLLQHLEKKSADALKNLKNHMSSQTYTQLAKVTLAQVIFFNRRPAVEISRMTHECFKNRGGEDKADGLSPFEQRLSKRFSRVGIMDKEGRNVAVLLNPELVSAIQLIVNKRDACDVDRENPYVFGRPSSSSFFRGQDCIRVFVSQCGAQNPEYLGSTRLRKHVATISQILHLKDKELDQLAKFLGLDIWVHKDYYRLPDAAAEIAKISKVVLAMERGTSASDEIGTEAEIDLEKELSDDKEEEEASDPSVRVRGNRKMPPDETRCSTEGRSRRGVKRPWSANEVNAVMKHFKSHIYKGKLATNAECEQCKIAEDPVLKERTTQNIRDFVRNRGVMLKKQHP